MVKTIVEEGSLTKASEKLFVSQSALSHHLKRLEDALGAQIFHRVKKKLVAAPVGLRIVESSKSILSELNRLHKDLEALNNGESGMVRISTECYTCYNWLPPVLKGFQQDYPNCEIKIVSQATRQPMDYLDRSELDIAIVGDIHESERYVSQKLFSDEMLAVLSQDHPLAKKKILLPEDFTGQSLILYDVPDDQLFFMREMMIPNGIELKQVMKFELTEAMIELVAAGMGISIMANWIIEDYKETKGLVAIPISQKPIVRNWYATSQRRDKSKAVDNFLGYLQSWPSFQAQ